jgi:hypothetical protein
LGQPPKDFLLGLVDISLRQQRREELEQVEGHYMQDYFDQKFRWEVNQRAGSHGNWH